MTLEEQRTRTRQFQTEVSMLTTRLGNFEEKVKTAGRNSALLLEAVWSLGAAQDELVEESRNLTKQINDEIETKQN